MFAWYIPKQYTDEQMEEIYGYLKNEILTDLEYFIAGVSYERDNYIYSYNVFSEQGKTIINYDVFGREDSSAVARGLFYDGTLKEWDVENLTETVTEKDASDYAFLFDRIKTAAEYFKNDVLNKMPYRDDSYCHQCFPYGFGMAQMYYLPENEDVNVSASWTVEKFKDADELPLIHDAEFNCGRGDEYVIIEAYGSPYGIDDRIDGVTANYENYKQTDGKMLNKQIYVKGFDDVLTIELYNNDASKALFDKVAEGDVTVTFNDYGGFEKVGSLGFDLPTNDEQITTDCGDVMLYCGNQMVVFYGQNTWDYTPLGFIAGYSDAAFKDVIQAGYGAKQITLSLNRD
ncbi:MAG: cyclophilin-like fold protein [Firmicutes bacterium]|nr:cyclophilin-like fold protein [Bacillota bacterium]